MKEAVNKLATEKSLMNRLLGITDPMEDLCNEQLMADAQSVMDDLWREEKARTMVHGEGTLDQMMEFLFDGAKPGRDRLPTQGTQALAQGRQAKNETLQQDMTPLVRCMML